LILREGIKKPTRFIGYIERVCIFELNLIENTMNTNSFERVEMNGKRLKTDLLLICKELGEDSIMDIYAMRIYNC